MPLPFQQPPPPPCVKCGSTTVIALYSRGANAFSRFDARRAGVPGSTRSIMTPYASGEPHPTRPPAAQVSAAIALLDRAWGRSHQALEVGISRASLEDMSNAEFY
jgi:hypothetical protein